MRIGISGWRYPPWRGVFYPDKLPQRLELTFASRALSSIELNGSFYALQKPGSYAEWFAHTPEDFVFSIKAPKFITHVQRLRDVEAPIANFIASGLFALKHKLGPILWQFPPSMRFDAPLFEDFLAQLPHDTDAASKIAHKRDPFMAERELLSNDARRPMRHAVEIRNQSFVEDAGTFIDMLSRYEVALVVADTAGKWPFMQELTTDFMYLRLHGDKELYASGYTDEALEKWAERIDAWRSDGRDIHCYFDNDIKVHAPFDAARLAKRLGLASNLTDEGRFQVQLPQA